MKKISCLLAILMAGLVLTGCVPAQSINNQQNYDMEKGEGRLIFGITDAATNLESINSVQLTVDKIEAHSTTEGWVTLSDDEKTFDLIELKNEGKIELAADASVKEGIYNQLRMEVSRVLVVDQNGTYEAKLPSNELKVNTEFTVEEGKATATTFDFLLDESLHVTGDGKYILAPVIQVETREDVEVEVDASNKIEIKEGYLKHRVKVGMDEEGNVGVGLGIPADTLLLLDTRGKVSIGSKTGIGIGGSGKTENNSNMQGNINVKGSLNY